MKRDNSREHEHNKCSRVRIYSGPVALVGMDDLKLRMTVWYYRLLEIPVKVKIKVFQINLKLVLNLLN
jgi:hypothetical protein